MQILVEASPFICVAMLHDSDGARRVQVRFNAKTHQFRLGIDDEFTKRRIMKLFDLQGVTYQVTN
jgi:hypothetical protein